MSSDSRRNTNQQFVHVSLVFILISTIFLITASPIAILKTLKNRMGDTYADHDPLQAVQTYVLWSVFERIAQTNHGLYFLLYVITGSTFRNELKALLTGNNATDAQSSDNGTSQSAF